MKQMFLNLWYFLFQAHCDIFSEHKSESNSCKWIKHHHKFKCGDKGRSKSFENICITILFIEYKLYSHITEICVDNKDKI